MIFHDALATDEDIAAFLGPASLLAHANDTGESFGMVIAEAMACGLPVVTHPCPGSRDNAQLELVEHGITGLVARDAGEYAEAVVFLLTHPAEARAMGRAGRDKAAALYRAQTVAARLETVYQEIITRKGITP
jgi:glycosyltransferase involved in cell wall biosynthesis